MARTTQRIHTGWYFTKQTIDAAAPDYAAMQAVAIPHTWNALDGQDGGADYDRGAYWYARQLKLDAIDGEIWLEFEGVSQKATVYINGAQAARHTAGFSTFRVNATPFLQVGVNELAVLADNGENTETYPQFADFTFYGGIYRNVNLISLPAKHFALDNHGAPGLKVTPELCADGSAKITLCAAGAKADGCTYRFAIAEADGTPVFEQCSETESTVALLATPHLWQGRSDPYLYTATAQLVCGDAVCDTVSLRFGVRSFHVDPNEGFILNGVKTPLRGVSRHQCREDKGWAISDEDMKQDMELICEMGANTIRLAHYQHSQYFYDLCDEYGVVAWAEIPFISNFMENPAAKANTLLQMRELVLQSRHHASICFWGISNEITISGDENPALIENQRELVRLCNELDNTRLTALANLSVVEMDSVENTLTDVVGYNHYFGWYVGDASENGPWLDEFHAKYPDIPVALTEYGAEGNYNLHSETPQVRDYSEEYQCVYHEAMLDTFATRPYLWGTYVWNMFEFGCDMRDEGMVKGRNNKGLVNFSRTVKKDAFYLYKAWWTQQAFVHVCGRRFAQRCGETSIKVYGAVVDAVELRIDGAVHARVSGSHVFAFAGITLSLGEHTIEAVGYCAGVKTCAETITLQGVAQPNPAYSMPEDDLTGDGVTNWFDPDYQGSPLTFDPDYYSIKDTIGEVIEHPEAHALLTGMFASMAGGAGGAAPKMNKGMLRMIGNMTFEGIAKMAGKRMPPEALAQINSVLQTIKK